MAKQVLLRQGLTGEETTAFHTDGYLPLGRFVDDDQLTVLRRRYDDVLARDVGHTLRGTAADGSAISQVQVLKPEEIFPELWHTEFFTKGRQLAAELLDTAANELRGFSHLTYKQAHTGRDTPWHQDEAYWMGADLATHEPQAVTFWLTLDEASTTSGCMSFIPGSHTRTHAHVFIDDETSGLMVPDPDTASAREWPMSAGEASVHHCRSVHKAGANTSGHQRRAWSLEFHGAPTPRADADTRTWLPELRERMTRRAPLGLI